MTIQQASWKNLHFDNDQDNHMHPENYEESGSYNLDQHGHANHLLLITCLVP